jgi:RNA processing factor Prp31
MCFKEMKKKKLKIWDNQIKSIIEAKKTSYKKWLPSKKLEDITACKSTFNTLYC